MGRITDYLTAVLRRHLDQNGIVVWYDPPGHFQEIISELELNAPVIPYQGSFFELRSQIEPNLSLGKTSFPRMVIYVPLSPLDFPGALAEVESCGIVLQPGKHPPEQNTSLAYIARQALEPILPEDRMDEIEQEISQGRFSLEDLEILADHTDVTFDQMLLIFGTESRDSVALQFLNQPEEIDQQIIEKSALSELVAFLESKFGADLPDSNLENLRIAFARHVLLTDLLQTISGEVPKKLTGIKVPEGHIHQEHCLRLASKWRDSRQFETQYQRIAGEVEKPLGLSQIDWSLSQLKNVNTFLSTENALQNFVEIALLDAANAGLVDLARERQRHFWATVHNDVQSRWALIRAVGELILFTDSIDRELQKDRDFKVHQLTEKYTEGEKPWCLLDTYHRKVELLWVGIFNNFTPGDELEKLVAQGRKRYKAVVSLLSKNFITAFEQANFQLEGTLPQTTLFNEIVKPAIKNGKTAYLIVDAFRFEMACDLVSNILSEDFCAELFPAVAAVPTITEIGMAALLPGADQGKIISPQKGKLAMQVGEKILAVRSDRIQYLQDTLSGKVLDLKLDELRTRSKSIKEQIAKADFIFVTSQEIDQFGETGDQAIARETMDAMLRNLHLSLRILRENDVKNIIITSDHGHIFVDAITDDLKIDHPGEAIDLHRRSWVGKDGIDNHKYIYTALRDFGLDSDYDYATPLTFNCFKVSSSLNYFHGGISPQELFVPCIKITSDTSGKTQASDIGWEVVPGSQTIGRVFSVTISGKALEMFDIQPAKVRVAVQMGDEVVSNAISASYDLEQSTGYIQMRSKEDNPLELEENTVTLLVEKGEAEGNIGRIILFDAEMDAILFESEKMEITIFE